MICYSEGKKVMSRFNKVNSITYKSHLLNGSFANFYDKFHDKNNTNDTLYKKISQLCEEHKKINRTDDVSFKLPYNSDGFYFKAEPYIKCTDRHGNSCIIDDLYDTDVQMTMRIIPYDLIDKSTNQRKVGVIIKVLSIKGL